MRLIIGFSRAKCIWKIGSAAIRFAESRDYSHTYVEYICPLTSETMIAQSSHGRVNLMNKSLFVENNTIVKQFDIVVGVDDFKKVILFVCKNLGREYSISQVIFIAIKKLLHFEIPQYNKDKYFICSEFSVTILGILGIRIPDKLDYFTPSDLESILKQNNISEL